ncbi:hypothetical protein CPB83DRAFT_871039 [Crepidotus variabilis]|uniref:Heat shock 70 kDa protein 12A n=1 Tax=Crepidotus variabilis TaxID=179855 RepID=A0A9P6JLL2_9AGAR|nr:hypothetical protein CPB83DRAFT_871039 [Crepidotus variabilis]
MSNRQPYSGPFRKLVLAFDVGTTFSGISYCILDPGEVPVIRGVTRFPAQEQVGGDSKIPTIIYYDNAGRMQAAGAEAAREGTTEIAEDEEWAKAEWFKLHLRPNTTSTAFVSEKIPPLPKGKAAVDVFADFLGYLHQCARLYIEETHANGADLWRSLETRTEFVLTHPNGWEGGQQGLMRKAAISAGLVPDTDDGRSRLSFVTEGEASLHFCIQSGLTTRAIQDGKGILIVDAGGGTIDVSAYRRSNAKAESYEEIAPPQCAFKGSIFVTRNANEYLQKLLKGSKFVVDIPHITERFDKTTKLRFVNPDEAQFIKFGGLRDRAPELNIKSGQLKLQGSDVAKFFEPSISAITQIVENQCKTSKIGISSVFLVGGFAASNWLFNNLKDALKPRGIDVCRPDNHTNKAVADGAVSYHIDHFVQARIAKYSYGVRVHVPYNSSDPEHMVRKHAVFTDLEGHQRVGGHFDVILPKVTSVSETEEFRQHYMRESTNQADLKTISQAVMCFRGYRGDPRWLDEENSLYSTLCYVEADLSHIPMPGKYSNHIHGLFYDVTFDVILALGLTEFKAFIAWRENVRF